MSTLILLATACIIDAPASADSNALPDASEADMEVVVDTASDMSEVADASPTDAAQDLASNVDAAGEDASTDAATSDMSAADMTATQDMATDASTGDVGVLPDTGPDLSAPFTCPRPKPPENPCIQVIAWAKDPETGNCCQYPTPCHAPEGWETFPSEAACSGA